MPRTRAQKQAYAKAWNKATKDAVFNAYGGYICACCGEKEPIFLVIDHIHGGGNIERRKYGTNGGAGQYWRLAQAGFPSGYQVLCHNCNFAKDRMGKCPHKLRQEFKVDFKEILNASKIESSTEDDGRGSRKVTCGEED